MKHSAIFPSLLLAAVIIASCHPSTETMLNNGPVTWATPGVGAKYIYGLDISYISTTPYIDTETVIATGLQIGGQSNVIRILFNIGYGVTETRFLMFEPNGDITLGDSGSAVPDSITWETYPTASHQSISDPTDSVNGGFGWDLVTDVRSFVDSETVITVADTFSTIHIREVNRTITTSFPIDTSFQNYDYWFAPSIGNYIKIAYSQTSGLDTISYSSKSLIKYIPSK